MKLTLNFFGTFNAALDNELLTHFEADTARALLVYLALNPETPFRRETLAALLWPEQDETSALHALRQALNRLRTTLREREADTPFLNVTRHTIQLNPQSTVWSDVSAFNVLLHRTQTHPHRRRAVCWSCLQQLEKAAALYQGDLLAGFHLDSLPFEEWLLMQREQLHVQVLEALYELTDAYLRRGAYARAQHYARRQLALEPWREEAHQQLLRALALDGQRSTALAHYKTCRKILADELSVEPNRETQQLYTAIREERQLPGRDAPLYRVPEQFTPLIGRARALQQLTAQLNAPDCHILSLIGPGGVGKTRLAIALAETLRGDFEHGVVFIPLAAVTAPELIFTALAHALDFTFHENMNLTRQLRTYLSTKELLLVFDNFEHLIDGATPLLQLLHHAPQVVSVFTSRERLNVPGERVFPVTGLNYEDDSTNPASAHELFISTAERTVPDVTFTTEDRRAITQICRSVAGIPLAIELAATWLRAFNCQEIAVEIQRSFDFLETPLQGQPERHRSLRAVFEHSWALLSPTEQTTLSQLSVFQGAFDREAAQHIAAASPTLLAALLDQSLLQRMSHTTSEQTQYMMHDLVQQYAREQLLATPTLTQETNARHAHYFLTWLAAQYPLLIGPEVKPVLTAIETAFPNVRAAWKWAVKHTEVTLLATALPGLFLFYDLRFWTHEAEHTFGQTATALASSDTRAAQILIHRLRASQGWFATLLEGEGNHGRPLLQQALTALRDLEATEHLPFVLNALSKANYLLSDYNEARQYSSASYTLSEQLEDRYNQVVAQHILGQAHQAQGHYEESLQLLQASLELAHRERFVKLESDILRTLGVSYWRHGEYARAREYFTQTLENCRTIGDRYGEGRALTALGTVSFLAEACDEARVYYQEGLQIAREIGDRRSEGQALNNLAEVHSQCGEYAQAALLCEASLRIKQEVGDLRGEAMTLGNLANMVKYQGDYAAAEQYLKQALAIFQELQDPLGQAMALAVLTALAGELNQPESALVYGQAALTINQAQQQRHIHANLLTNLAHALLDLGRLTEAQQYYQEALTIREELGQAALAVEPLAGLADVALARGDTPSALDYVNQILSAHELRALRGIDQLFRPAAVCLRALKHVDDPRLPQLTHAVHEELQIHAAKIHKRALRQQFLTDIAPHRMIVSLYQAQDHF